MKARGSQEKKRISSLSLSFSLEGLEAREKKSEREKKTIVFSPFESSLFPWGFSVTETLEQHTRCSTPRRREERRRPPSPGSTAVTEVGGNSDGRRRRRQRRRRRFLRAAGQASLFLLAPRRSHQVRFQHREKALRSKCDVPEFL